MILCDGFGFAAQLSHVHTKPDTDDAADEAYVRCQGCLQKLKLHKASTSNVTILKDITGVLLPGRFTLLLGHPGSGKSMLLKALAGKLQKTTLKVNTTASVVYCVSRRT